MDYAKLAKTAAGVISKFGSTATLTRVPKPGSYNPATSTVAAPANPTTEKITVATYPESRPLYQDRLEGAIETGDIQMVMSAVGVEAPRPGDMIEWNGVNHVVVFVKDTAPAGISVLYELQVRR